MGYSSANPSFGGDYSIIGHSLGSVITWDLVSLMSPAPEPGSPPARFQPEASTLAAPSLPKPPTLAFLLGSPIGLFLTLRGAQEELLGGVEGRFRLEGAKKVLNVYHPSDPVAVSPPPRASEASARRHNGSGAPTISLF
jgi:hypothetical protein